MGTCIYLMEIPEDYKKYITSLHISETAETILKNRYYLKRSDGEIIEDLPILFYRVAKNIASIDMDYEGKVQETEEKFFKAMAQLEIIPASPILMNAGARLQHLFSDHALDVRDSLEAVFETLKIAASIHQNGGGVGFNFSKIRPKGDLVSGMQNVAFGPISVMKIFDMSFSTILQGGRRPGANMAILSINHPDIYSFVEAKKDINNLTNFNLSIAITNDFIKAVIDDTEFDLINPRNNEITKTIRARDLFEHIAESAWSTGDPGLVFIDEMNKKYPFKSRKVLCTSCCGQYELEKYEGVPYVHINLIKTIKTDSTGTHIDTEKLKELVHTSVHFLDNCIDAHKYSQSKIKEKTKASRKVGLGVMGFADLLFKLRIPYGSSKSLKLIEEIMSIVKDESIKASENLTKTRSPFPEFNETNIETPRRNATLTAISPTGTTSLIAGVSQSIEPVYALSYTAKSNNGQEYAILNNEFEDAVNTLNLTSTEKVQLKFVDSVKKISWLDEEFKSIFKTSHDVTPKEHLKVMAKFQKYVDNSISKTINLSNSASIAEVQEIFLEAFKSKCKGITIYRDGCRTDQILGNKRQTKLFAFDI